jgi:hypothetical protein
MSKSKNIDDISLLLLKLEATEELGLKEKVKKVGWGGLTSEETGKLGGYMTSKIKKLNQDHQQE